MPSRDFVLRFKQQGLSDIRTEIQKTYDIVKTIQGTASRAAGSNTFVTGGEASRVDKIVKASISKFKELEQQLIQTRKAQEELYREQSTARLQGRTVPQQLRDSQGRFGKSAASLERREQELIAQIFQNEVDTLNKLNAAKQRSLAASQQDLNVQREIQRVQQQAAQAAATGQRRGNTRLTPGGPPDRVQRSLPANPLPVANDAIKATTNALKQTGAAYNTAASAAKQYAAANLKVGASLSTGVAKGIRETLDGLVGAKSEVKDLAYEYEQLVKKIYSFDKRVSEGVAQPQDAGIEVDGQSVTRQEAVELAVRKQVEVLAAARQAWLQSSEAAKIYGDTGKLSAEKLTAALEGARKAVNIASNEAFGGAEQTIQQAIDNRIRQLESQSEEISKRLAELRQQLTQDYPAGPASQIRKFEKAQQAAESFNSQIKQINAELRTLEGEGRGARKSGILDLLGSKAAVGKRSGEEREEDVKRAERLNFLLERRSRLYDRLESAQAKAAEALEGVRGVQAGQQVPGLRPIEELVGLDRKTLKEIAELSGRNFAEPLLKKAPELEIKLGNLRKSVDEFDAALASSTGAQKQVEALKALQVQVEGARDQVELLKNAPGADSTAVAAAEGNLQILEQQFDQARGLLADAILNEPEIAARAEAVFDNLAQVSQEAEKEIQIDPIPPASDYAKRLGAIDGLLFETLNGLKRRFITTFQFILSGTIIFGIQRIAKEFVQAAIEVERTFADIDSALRQTQTNLTQFERATSLENTRRQVLAIANELNVLPAEANQAAYQMVARFRFIDAALIATRAQLLATKVSTIDQAEILRALTAAGDVFSRSLDENVRGYERAIATAQIYAKVLDGATVIQQEFGVAVEDTVEGAAQLGEVFSQLGFDYAEIEAAVGLVSRQTGQTGTVVADRLARSIGTILTPDVRSELLKLSQDSELRLSIQDFLPDPDTGDPAGARAIRKIEDQILSGLLSGSTTNRVREILGGRREAAFVAAYFGTVTERRTAANDVRAGTGAAQRRFEILNRTVSESIASVIAQFQSLAQNLSELGFLQPMSLLLGSLEAILRVINGVIQAIGGMVNALNAIPVPGAGGLGDLLVTITSLALAANTFGNAFKNLGSAVNTFGAKAKFQKIIQDFIAFQAASTAIPKTNAGKFATTLFGASALGARGRTPSFGGRIPTVPVPLTRRGPLAAGRLGLASLTGGVKELTAATVLSTAATKADAAAETAQATATRASACAAGTNSPGGLGSTIKALSRSFLAAAAPALKFLAIVGAIGLAFDTALNFTPGRSPLLYGRSRSEQIALDEEAKAPEPSSFDDEGRRRLGAIDSEIGADIQKALDELYAAYEGSYSAIGGVWNVVTDGVVRGLDGLIGFDQNLIGTLPEGQITAIAVEKQRLFQEILKKRIEVLQDALSSGLLDDEATAEAERQLALTQSELRTSADPVSPEFDRLFQGYVDDAIAENFAGASGAFAQAWREGFQGADLRGDRGVSADAIGEFEDDLVGIIEGLGALDPLLELLAGAEGELDPAGYTRNLNKAQTLFGSGGINRKEFFEVLRANIEGAKRARADAAASGEASGLVDEFNETIADYLDAYIETLTNFDDAIRFTGNALAEAVQRTKLAQEAYREYVDAIRADVLPFDASTERQLFESAQRERIASQTQKFDNQISFIESQIKLAGGDIVQLSVLLRERRDRILEEWDSLTDALINQPIPDYAPFADRLRELQEAFFSTGIEIRNLVEAQAELAFGLANKSALLKGDALIQQQQVIAGLKAAIAEVKSRSSGDENAGIILDLEIQLANAQRAQLDEQIRRIGIRARANTRLGDELAAGRTEADILWEAYRLTLAANVIEEEKIAARDAWRRAEDAYFDSVLKYSALLKKADIDLTDPLAVARADAEIAAEEYANAVGAIERETASQNLERATAAEQRAFYDDRLDELGFLYDTDQISKGAYIESLRKLQAGVDRSTKQGEQIWRDIERTILGLVDEIEQGFNIPSEIRLPTLFEVRRAVQAEEMGVNYIDNRQQDINIFVSDTIDLQDAMDIIGRGVDLDASRTAPGAAGIVNVNQYYG